MKRPIVLILLFTISLFAAGCLMARSHMEVREFVPYGAQGAGNRIVIKSVPEIAFVGNNTKLPSSFPIYTNRYAFGQEGPLFKIDDKMTEMMTGNLARYLGLLGEKSTEGKYGIVKHPEVPYKVLYDNGRTETWSGVSDISIITDEYNIIQDVTSGNIEGNKLVKAAVEYLNIKKPQMASEVEYDDKGNVYQYLYTFTENSDDLFRNILNSSFSYARVTYSPKSEDVLVVICKIDMPEKYGDYKIVSYAMASNYLRGKYPDVDAGTANAEIYYSATVQSGYYIPCYKFYLGEAPAKDGTVRYRVVHIPMVDKR